MTAGNLLKALLINWGSVYDGTSTCEVVLFLQTGLSVALLASMVGLAMWESRGQFHTNESSGVAEK